MDGYSADAGVSERRTSGTCTDADGFLRQKMYCLAILCLILLIWGVRKIVRVIRFYRFKKFIGDREIVALEELAEKVSYIKDENPQ